MTELAEKALLPTGLQDILPPDAAFEAAIAEQLLGHVAQYGYERVKPPLVEFEDGLLAGAGAGLSEQTFRLMDPVSRRMMAVRSDATPQVARIATSRLSKAPRPLRLSYAGDILRVEGGELRPERQFCQVGFELIGSAAATGDAEVVLMAAEAVTALGVEGLSVDITAPTLVTAVLESLALDGEATRDLRGALDRKDEAGVRALAGDATAPLLALLRAVGPAGPALARLAEIDLPAGARRAADALAEVAALIGGAAPDLALTIDPVEHRSFEYHTGTSFALFARGVRGELGRGGRYTVGQAGTRETATGSTLYLDTLLRALPRPAAARRVYVPASAPPEAARRLRADGWVAVAGLEAEASTQDEARRLACSHIWTKSGAQSLDK